MPSKSTGPGKIDKNKKEMLLNCYYHILIKYRPVGRNFQRGVGRHALRVTHLAAGGMGALSHPQKPRGICSKILQSSKFKAFHSNFRKVLFFKIQILHQLGL